jgi:hypothetical protein
MAAGPILVLDVDTHAARVRVEFNGVPVVDRPSRAFRSSVKLNGWAREENGLRVFIESSTSADPDARVGVAVSLIRQNDDPASDEKLVDYTWPPASAAGSPPLGLVREATINFAPRARWRWVDADPVESIEGSDRAQIVDILLQLRRAMVTRDAVTAIALQRLQLEEAALAVADQPQAYFEAHLAYLQGRMSFADWQVRDLDTNDLLFRRCADGRLFRVSRSDGGPPVETRSGGSSFAVLPYFSRLRGRWTVVR